MKMKKFYSRQAIKRKVFVMAIISLLLAVALELYTFGIPSDFLIRLLRSSLVIFILTAVTALGIIPAINWAVNKAANS